MASMFRCGFFLHVIFVVKVDLEVARVASGWMLYVPVEA